MALLRPLLLDNVASIQRLGRKQEHGVRRVVVLVYKV